MIKGNVLPVRLLRWNGRSCGVVAILDLVVGRYEFGFSGLLSRQVIIVDVRGDVCLEQVVSLEARLGRAEHDQ